MYDFNISFCKKRKLNKHCLSNGLGSMNFKQTINGVICPASGTCFDHIFSNHLAKIKIVLTPGIGLSDKQNCNTGYQNIK